MGVEGAMRELERTVMLQVLDNKWREHLYELDYLQEGIGLRGMAGRGTPWSSTSPRPTTCSMGMLDSIKEESVGFLFNVQVEAVPQTAPTVAPVATPQGLADLGAPEEDEQPSGRHAAATLRAKGIDDEESRQLTYSGPAEDGSAEVKRNGGASTPPRPAAPARSAARPQRQRAKDQKTLRAGIASTDVQGDDLPAHSGDRRHLLHPAGDRAHPLVAGVDRRPPRPPCRRCRRVGPAPVATGRRCAGRGGRRPAGASRPAPRPVAAAAGPAVCDGRSPRVPAAVPRRRTRPRPAAAVASGTGAGRVGAAGARAAGQAHRAGSVQRWRLVVDDGNDAGHGHSPVIGRRGTGRWRGANRCRHDGTDGAHAVCTRDAGKRYRRLPCPDGFGLGGQARSDPGKWF